MPAKYPGKLLHKTGVILGGIWIASSILNATLGNSSKSLLRNSIGSDQKDQSLTIKKQYQRIIFIVKGSKQIKSAYQVDSKREVSSIVLLTLSQSGEIKLLNIPNKLKIKDNFSKKVTSIDERIEAEGIKIILQIIRDILDLKDNQLYGYIVLEKKTLKSAFNNFNDVKSLRIKNSFNQNSKLLDRDLELSNLINTLLKEISDRSNNLQSDLDFKSISRTIKTNLSKDEILTLINQVKRAGEKPIIDNFF